MKSLMIGMLVASLSLAVPCVAAERIAGHTWARIDQAAKAWYVAGLLDTVADCGAFAGLVELDLEDIKGLEVELDFIRKSQESFREAAELSWEQVVSGIDRIYGDPLNWNIPAQSLVPAANDMVRGRPVDSFILILRRLYAK